MKTYMVKAPAFKEREIQAKRTAEAKLIYYHEIMGEREHFTPPDIIVVRNKKMPCKVKVYTKSGHFTMTANEFIQLFAISEKIVDAMTKAVKAPVKNQRQKP